MRFLNFNENGIMARLWRIWLAGRGISTWAGTMQFIALFILLLFSLQEFVNGHNPDDVLSAAEYDATLSQVEKQMKAEVYVGKQR